METESDEYYLQRVMNGDTNAFSFIVNKYKDMIYGICLNIVKESNLAEEIAQDTFMKAFNNLENFRMESRFSTWIYRIAYNSSISAIRRKKVEFCPIENNIVDNYSIEEMNDDLRGMDRDLIKRRLISTVDNLSEKDRALVHLFYMENNSIEEISEITSLSKSNVKVKLHRLRKKLFKELSDYIESRVNSLSVQ